MAIQQLRKALEVRDTKIAAHEALIKEANEAKPTRKAKRRLDKVFSGCCMTQGEVYDQLTNGEVSRCKSGAKKRQRTASDEDDDQPLKNVFHKPGRKKKD